jgi:translation initiation factor IF-1
MDKYNRNCSISNNGYMDNMDHLPEDTVLVLPNKTIIPYGVI